MPFSNPTTSIAEHRQKAGHCWATLQAVQSLHLRYYHCAATNMQRGCIQRRFASDVTRDVVCWQSEGLPHAEAATACPNPRYSVVSTSSGASSSSPCAWRTIDNSSSTLRTIDISGRDSSLLARHSSMRCCHPAGAAPCEAADSDSGGGRAPSLTIRTTDALFRHCGYGGSRDPSVQS